MEDDLTTDVRDLRLTTQADVQHLWERLMTPLGFSGHSIWFCLVDDRGAPFPQLTEIGDGDDRTPDAEEVVGLCDMLDHLAAELDRIAGVAFLLTRPGSWGMTDADRVLAGRLVAGMRRTALTCYPVHVADDREILAVAPDDLAAA